MRLKLLLLFVVAALATSCDDKDDDELELDDHDKNGFMAIMHDMNDQMEAMEMTGDPDHDFAMMMTIHHQGAIDMSNKVLEDGEDPVIMEMAQMIIDKQQMELSELNSWLQSHTPEPSPEGEAFNTEKMAVMEKMKNWKDIQVLTGDADNDFAELMIIHHQHAIDNAQSILHHGHHDEIREMAQMMIEDQNNEIKDLAAWIRDNGAVSQ